MDRCEYCGVIGCEWTRHAEAREEVRLWEIGKHPDHPGVIEPENIEDDD